jgi:hypothetical protein
MMNLETLKKLLPGMFDPGGTQPYPKNVYIVTIETRLYCSTDYNEIHRFGLHYRHPFIDVLDEKSFVDIRLRLVTPDYRILRM